MAEVERAEALATAVREFIASYQSVVVGGAYLAARERLEAALDDYDRSSAGP